MRRSIRFMMVALAAGICTILCPAAGASASSGPSGSLGPPGSFGVRLVDVPVSEANNPRGLRYIVDYLPVGAVIHRRILIANEEARTARFIVYASAAHIAGGQFVGDGGATRNELTTWVRVQHPVVTLAARSSVMDLVTIKVPAGATRGEQYGVIWVQQTSTVRPPGTKSSVTEVSRVGVRLYVAVGRGGAPPTSFDITSITGHRTASGQPVISTHVNNTGGRAIDLNGRVSLAHGPGNSSAGPFSGRGIVTLAPGQSGNITFDPPKSLPDGSWQATVTLTSGITTATATATVQFSPHVVAPPGGLSTMELILLALGGLVVLLAAAVGWYALSRRRQAPA